NVEIKLTGADRTIFHPSNIRLNMNGLNIPLTYVASIERGSQPEQFQRVNQTPVLSYVSNLALGDWFWGQKKIQQMNRNFARKTGTEVRVGGAAVEMSSLMKQMTLLLLISVLIIYLIIVIQF